MIRNIVSQLDVRYSEGSCWTLWQMTKDQRVWFSMLLVPQHEVGKSFLARVLYKILNQVILPFIVLNARDARLDLLQESKQAAPGSSICLLYTSDAADE